MKHTNAELEIVPHAPFEREGVKYPPGVFGRWSRAEKAAIGIYEVVPDEVPEGKVAVAWALEMADGYVREVPELEDYVAPVPASVSPLQIRKALRQMELKAPIDDYIATQDEETQEAWEYAVQIDRDNPEIAAAAAELDKSEADIDDLFRLAATL